MTLNDEMIGIVARHFCDRLEELDEDDRVKVLELVFTEYCQWCGRKIEDGNDCNHERAM